jgi:hypothetical protein
MSCCGIEELATLHACLKTAQVLNCALHTVMMHHATMALSCKLMPQDVEKQQLQKALSPGVE